MTARAATSAELAKPADRRGRPGDKVIYQCAQVTDLPSTGTGPGIGAMDAAAWWSELTAAQVALMGVGALGAMLLAGWGATRRLRS